MFKLLLASAIAAVAASSALADHTFLMPSFSNLNGSQSVVQIDAAGADNVFQFDHRPVQLDQIKVWRPDGSEAPAPQGMTSRFRSTFDLQLDHPGTWKIAAVSTMVNGTAKVGGEERRVSSMRFGRPGGTGGPGGGMPAGRPGEPQRLPPILLAELPADATEVKLTENLNRAEAFVTSGEPTTGVFSGDARGITLQPITNPTDTVSNEPAKFRLLIDGKPAAKLAVQLIAGGQRFRNNEAATELITDAGGVVTIKWPAPGYYLLTATAEDAQPTEKRAAVRRMSYAATIEVAAP